MLKEYTKYQQRLKQQQIHNNSRLQSQQLDHWRVHTGGVLAFHCIRTQALALLVGLTGEPW
jgi:hypothetical protein